MTNWEQLTEHAKSIVQYTQYVNQHIANSHMSWGTKECTIRRREKMLRELEQVVYVLERYDPIYLGM